MTIAREEIFGPVLVDPPVRRPRRRPSRWRTTRCTASRGTCSRATWLAPAGWRASCAPAKCSVNGAPGDMAAPFGGYKQSGNGREWGKFGFEEFLEVKAVLGYQPS